MGKCALTSDPLSKKLGVIYWVLMNYIGNLIAWVIVWLFFINLKQGCAFGSGLNFNKKPDLDPIHEEQFGSVLIKLTFLFSTSNLNV